MSIKRKTPKSVGLLWIGLFFSFYLLASCKPQHPVKLTSSATPQPQKVSGTPVPSLQFTEFYTPYSTGEPSTLTQMADARLNSYIFPDDIDPVLAQVIQITLESKLNYSPPSGKLFLSYVLLHPPQLADDGSIIVYLYSRSREFYVDKGELLQGGGMQIPVSLTLEEKSQGWHVEMETPQRPDDGWNPAEVFPQSVLPLLTNFPKVISDKITGDIVQQAENHFGLLFDPEKNSFPQAWTPTPLIRILTLTPTPTVDLAALEPEVSADYLVSAGRITIKVDLFRGITRDFQKGLVSANWHIYLYARNPDGQYDATNRISLDESKHYDRSWGYGYEFYVQIPESDIPDLLGDTRGLVYQVVGPSGDIYWQDEIYLSKDLNNKFVNNNELDFPNDFPGMIQNGVISGRPNLMSVGTAPIFTIEEDRITVQEPVGGFHSLIYQYDIARETGITATAELASFNDTLVIELYPYRQDEDYGAVNALILEGEISGASGVLEVYLPHSWLDQARERTQEYILRVGDQGGMVYQEVLIQFIPHPSE